MSEQGFEGLTPEQQEIMEAREFWGRILDAFEDVCLKYDELDWRDEIENLREVTEHEALGALYDRLMRAWPETGEDPDEVIARHQLFEEKPKTE